jgi:hypothetical protein
MADKNEIVTIKLSADNRRKLSSQLAAMMVLEGHRIKPVRMSDDLDIGLDLPDYWPINGEATLAQLVVLAVKLKARIVISNINIVGRRTQKSKHRTQND